MAAATEAPSSGHHFHLSPTAGEINPPPGSPPPPPSQPAVHAAAAPPPPRKKRGRPRKLGHDGAAVAFPANTIPPSSSAPEISFSSRKRGEAKRPRSLKETNYDIPNLSESVACSVGASFTPHIISINAGEDVTMKIMSFAQQGPRAICIVSANGVISSVTLRRPDSSGGTLIYEGRFEVISLSGSFKPQEHEGTRSRTGGMSVTLASSDGRVIGGGVAGLLVAASTVQVVVGSFLPSNQHDQKPKRQKQEFMSASAPAMAAIPISISDPNPTQALHVHGTWMFPHRRDDYT